MGYTPADTPDVPLALDRVVWCSNHMPNPGLEDWNTPHRPDSMTVTVTRDIYEWYASAPWPVAEGSQSVGMQARALNTYDTAVVVLSQSSWAWISSPVNVTMRFSWYIDEVVDPTDGDSFRLEIRSTTSGRLTYLLGTPDSRYTNNTNYGYIYLNGPLKAWNLFDRNITADFLAVFGTVPTQLREFTFTLESRVPGLTRAFLDDVWFLNGTSVVVGASVKNGDFESHGSWYMVSPSGPAEVSQSSYGVQGQYCADLTAIGNGNTSYAYVYTHMKAKVGPEDPGLFSMAWELSNWSPAPSDTYAAVVIELTNSTSDFSIMYPFAYSGDVLTLAGPNDIIVVPEGFNKSGMWTLLNRSLWHDVTSAVNTSTVCVTGFKVLVKTSSPGTSVTLLIDDLSFVSATLGDKGYEDQGPVGTPVDVWPVGDSNPYLQVTDQSFSGDKALHLLMTDDEYMGEEQTVAGVPLTGSTDLYLDFKLSLLNVSGPELAGAAFEVCFADGRTLVYLLANNSPYYDADEYVGVFPVEGHGLGGGWSRVQRGLLDDYRRYFGTTPNTTVEYVYFTAQAGTNSSVELLLDDMYMYVDPEPLVSGVVHSPVTPEVTEDVTVRATVYDPSLQAVVLHYRTDSGPWITTTMTGDGTWHFTAIVPAQPLGTTVQYYVSANDSAGNVVEALNGSAFFSFTFNDTVAPVVSFSRPANGTTVSGVVTVNVTASDVGSGIRGLVLLVDNSPVAQSHSDVLTYDWDSSEVSPGLHTLSAIATDNNNNTAGANIVVTVSAPTTTVPTTGTGNTTTSTTPPPEANVLLPLALGGVVAGTLVVTAVIWMRRRRK